MKMLTIYEHHTSASFRVVLGDRLLADTDRYAARIYSGHRLHDCIDAALQKETRHDIRDRLTRMRGQFT